jgi:S1-C subfamily serine protease
VAQDLTPQLGEYFGAKGGVLVAGVSEGSPAAQAGIKAGDVITSVNGKAITSPDSLVRAVRDQPEGEELSLGILRDRKAQALKVKLLASNKGRPI